MSVTVSGVSNVPTARVEEDQAGSSHQDQNGVTNPAQATQQGAVTAQPPRRGPSRKGKENDDNAPGNLIIQSPPKVLPSPPPAPPALTPVPTPVPDRAAAPGQAPSPNDSSVRIDDFVKSIANDIPDVRSFAETTIEKIFKEKFKLDVQPETLRVVTVDYRTGTTPPYRGAIDTVTPLTDALINMVQSYPTVNGVPVPWRKDAPSVRLEKSVFFPPLHHHYPNVDEKGESFKIPNSYAGIFSTKNAPGVGDVLLGKSQIPVSPADVSKAIWNADFLEAFQNKLNAFWAKHRDTYPVAAKGGFLKQAERQKANGTLSSDGYDLARRMAQVDPGKRWKDVTPDELRRKQPAATNIDTGVLNISGYPSTDLLYARNRKSDLTLLYVPGDPSPIHTFENVGAMKAWIADQAADPATRQTLAGHFSIRNRFDGPINLGIDKELAALGDSREKKTADAGSLESIATERSTDPFKTLAGRTEQRAADDAESFISTRADYYKRIATPIIKALKYPATLLGAVYPAVGGPLLAGLGLADTFIGLHDVAHGKDGGSQASAGIIDVASATSARTKTGPNLNKTPSPRTRQDASSNQHGSSADAESHVPISDPMPSPSSPPASSPRPTGQKQRATPKDTGTTKPGPVEKPKRAPGDAHVTSKLSPDAIHTLNAMDDKRHFIGIMNVRTREIYIFPSGLVGNPGSGSEVRMPLPAGFSYKPGRNIPTTSLTSGDIIRFQKNSNGLLGHAALTYFINGDPEHFVGFSGIKEESNAFRIDWSAPTLNPRYPHPEEPKGNDFLRTDLREAVTRRFEKATMHVES
jgi:hypothetical protein